MPPEVKPVISSLAEMTCENCVYSITGEKLTVHPGQPDEHTLNRSDCALDNWDFNVRTSVDFCSHGRWIVGEPTLEQKPWPASFNQCYYMFWSKK